MLVWRSSRPLATRLVQLTVTLVGVAVVGAVAYSPSPAGAAVHTQAASWDFIGRYWVGTSAIRADGRTWAPDSVLHPAGGQVAVSAKRNVPTLYQQTRRGVRTLSVPTPTSGTYRVVLRSMTCRTTCSTNWSRVSFTTATAGRQTIDIPPAWQAGGISTVVVRRWHQPGRPGHRPIGAPTPGTSTPPTSTAPSGGTSTAPSGGTSTAPSGGTSTAPSGGTNTAPSSGTSTSTSWLQPQDVFGANSVWKTDISNAPVAANSQAQVANLASQVATRYGGNAAFNVDSYDVSWYNASANQATTTVQFTDCQNRGYTPSVLYANGDGPFNNVPIPANAQPAQGTDGWMTIYRASTDQLWDFWEASHDSTGWHACWGGRIDHASTSPGFFPNSTGASASGLASEVGDVSITDATGGSINHAVSLAIPLSASWNNYSWPAQRSDGSDATAAAIPEGTRFRLNPAINVDSLNLSPLATMIAKAAQKYGFIVTDQSGCVAVFAEDGAAAQNATGVDPWTNLLNGTPPYLVMKNFPWSSLQALPKNYGESS